MVKITLEVEKEIERRARERGLLSGEKIAALIETELVRLDKIDALKSGLTQAEIEEEVRSSK